MRQVHVIISGDVQGVGYRAWAAMTADRLGLCGWVRNVSDGTVEALLSGADDVVAEMLHALRKGPRLAGVSGVLELEWLGDTPPEGFAVLPTV